MDDLIHPEKEKNMRKLLMVLLAFAFVASSMNKLLARSPQARCGLTEANAPSVRGIKLGMTAQQVVDLFPAVIKRREMKDDIARAKAGGNEVVYLAFEPAGDGGGDRFAGVASVVTGVQKNRVVDFSIAYAGPTWSSIDEWVGKLSETLNLPAARDWVVGPTEDSNKVLRCSAIQIEASTQGGGATLRVRTNDSAREHAAHAGSSDENKRREFKP